MKRKILITNFLRAVVLGRGRVKKSGKSWIFENTPRSDDQLDHLPSNSVWVKNAATDLPSISCDQLDQLKLATDPQLIHEVITSKPIQGEGLEATDPTDPTDRLIGHPSEKIENENVSDCVKFIRTTISDNDPQVANCKTAPELNFEFGSRFVNNF